MNESSSLKINNTSAQALHDTSLVRRRDESNFNAFYQNMDIKGKRNLDVVPIEKKAYVPDDEDTILAREVKVVSKTLDVARD